MKRALRAMDAATYVTDIDASRAFYALLGFDPVRSGRGPASAWAALRNGRDTVLLTSTPPPLPLPRFPLLFCFFFEDLGTPDIRQPASDRRDRAAVSGMGEGAAQRN